MSFIDKAKKKLGNFADSAKDAVAGKDDKAEGAGEKAVDSSSQSTIDQVKGKQGIISKIQDFFTLGYSTKEDLRELDKKLRDSYYSDFKAMRHRWEEISLEALKARQRNKDEYKKVIQVIDRVGEKINRADYGYAGLMDRKGHIREDELAKVFNYDKALGNQVDDLQQVVEDIYGLVEAENWTEAPPKVRALKLMLLDVEEKWDGREKEFRPLEVS
jgi:uncharacterized protein YjbJ (UPF0337 family)